MMNRIPATENSSDSPLLFSDLEFFRPAFCKSDHSMMKFDFIVPETEIDPVDLSISGSESGDTSPSRDNFDSLEKVMQNPRKKAPDLTVDLNVLGSPKGKRPVLSGEVDGDVAEAKARVEAFLSLIPEEKKRRAKEGLATEEEVHTMLRQYLPQYPNSFARSDR